ncbi:hypothetical protein J3Q64DRAFT_1744258 [Phycomyces blakesleeanus]|uniref:Uncharacterized protein n=1 Tax=Phycomyces blakesleeanus TaxID=4837 RepID=A0ABR3AZE3_PHYBL
MNYIKMERYHSDHRRLCDEEGKIMASTRKSRFELELANWEGSKLEHQLELVQKQWEESGMEDLVREQVASRKSISVGISRSKMSI